MPHFIAIVLSLMTALTTSVAVAQTSKDTFDMSTALLRHHRDVTPSANLCLSPLSLQMAMAMVTNGAEGETRSEIVSAMGWEGMTDTQIDKRQQQLLNTLSSTQDITVELANSIWVNKQSGRLKRSFVKANRTYLDAEVTRLPFNSAATERINRWCASHTNDKIQSIVDQVDPAVQMYLINALYFKGTWLSRFNESLTRPGTFTTTAGTTQEVSMMRQQSYYEYAELDRCQLIDMPFVSVGEQQYSLYIALPKSGVTADALLDELDGTTWGAWTQQLRSEDVRLTLPRFKVEHTATLNSALQAMGIRRAFSAGQSDFSGIMSKSLAIDVVLQKTYLDVTESGAEAAAVTAISMVRTSRPVAHEVREMTVDRPFLFLLVEKRSGSVLFVGKVEQPK